MAGRQQQRGQNRGRVDAHRGKEQQLGLERVVREDLGGMDKLMM